MSSHTADVIVIGAGMAGASIAAELASHCQVILLEREEQPGYHSTGRSAAMFIANYGNAVVRCLTRASFGLLHQPPDDFAPDPLLKPRGLMYVAKEGQEAPLADLASLEGTRAISIREACQRIPLLREAQLIGALLEDDAMEIDVHGLHQGYLRRFRQHQGQLHCRATVETLERHSSYWSIKTPVAHFEAPIVVNAAGAWADELARLAGGQAVGLSPKRRTAAIIALPDGVQVQHWPLVVDAGETVYFRPEVNKLLISPADATPVPPCDVQAEELDVALAVHRAEELLRLDIQRVEHRWAGLRTFAPDSSPVVGWDTDLPGFFWLAGQGGYGIQMAPALARLSAALLRGEQPPQDLLELDLRSIGVARLRNSPH